MIVRKVDRKNKFISMFNTETGEYIRSGVIRQEGGKLVDTGIDPFMSDYPELIDVGVMGHCEHGASGKCLQGGVQCYQNGFKTVEPNMTLENFKRIVDECKGKTYQLALGGRGDVDQHENFEEILQYCRENNIVPNFTTSGLGLTDEKIAICKKYCGAIAVSWYRQEHTLSAIHRLIAAGVKTNIHYVLGNNSIDEAIDKLTNGGFPEGINAIIFLLHKPVGLGTQRNVIQIDDPKIAEFFKLIDGGNFPFKVGFDSCTIPGLVNFTSHINPDSFDTCEGGRWSMYITANMIALPCSFDNQDMKWAYDISNDSISKAWHSTQFADFRSHFRNACPSCKDRLACMGGCPIRKEVVLCGRQEKAI